jgi:ferrous iron transport protein A
MATSLELPAATTSAGGTQSTVSRRLLELGFIPGEAVEVIGEIWPGGDPMAVRVGNTTFALRRREAGAVLVAVAAV